MAGRPVRDHWIVCPDYAAGPYAADRVQAALGQIEQRCHGPHAIVRQATRPVVASPDYGDDD